MDVMTKEEELKEEKDDATSETTPSLSLLPSSSFPTPILETMDIVTMVKAETYEKEKTEKGYGATSETSSFSPPIHRQGMLLPRSRRWRWIMTPPRRRRSCHLCCRHCSLLLWRQWTSSPRRRHRKLKREERRRRRMTPSRHFCCCPLILQELTRAK